MSALRASRYANIFFGSLFLLVFIAIATGYILYIFVWRYQTYEVTLTREGFEPNNISINRGDAIIFSTSQDLPFWPASDNHPVHEIYPAFDPGKSIDAHETWQFRFWNVGMWKYHDHLFPPFRATITVLP